MDRPTLPAPAMATRISAPRAGGEDALDVGEALASRGDVDQVALLQHGVGAGQRAVAVRADEGDAGAGGEPRA